MQDENFTSCEYKTASHGVEFIIQDSRFIFLLDSRIDVPIEKKIRE